MKLFFLVIWGILLNTKRLRPPKSDREVMEKIANRVGFEFPAAQADNSSEDLSYVFDKLYLSLEKMNTPPEEEDQFWNKTKNFTT